MAMDSVVGDRTIQLFFAQQAAILGSSSGFTSLALRAKAAALYSAATHMSRNLGLRGGGTAGPMASTASSIQSFNTLEGTIVQFANTLLPAHQLGAGLPDKDRRAHVIVHTLAHAAYIQLHLRFAREGNVQSFDKCLRSARGAAQLIRLLNDLDYEFLDPVFVVRFIHIVIITPVLMRLQASWCIIAAPFDLEKSLSQGKMQRSEADLVEYAMTKSSTLYPVIGNLRR